jgi:hypothetical protein
MQPIGRNEPCPCGSGKKFKKCHLGREHELMEQLPGDAARRITSLPEVSYGRFKEITESLDVQKLTGAKAGVKAIDLKAYLSLGIGQKEIPPDLDRMSAGQMVNPIKTLQADPGYIYLALSPKVTDSTLIHQIAHVLDYLGGSQINPSLAKPLSLELELPLELLEHPAQFGDFLDFLRNEFAVTLDADDTIVHFLHQKGFLIHGEVIKSGDRARLEAQVRRSVDFLQENRTEIDTMIKKLAGYIKPDQNAS